MLDRERLLAKIDALDGYLKELYEILPLSIDEYKGLPPNKKRYPLSVLCASAVNLDLKEVVKRR